MTSAERGTTRRFSIDQSWERFGNTVLAGSPLVLFTTTDAGALVLDSVERGEPVGPSKLIDRLLDAGAIHPVVTDDRPSPTSSNLALPRWSRSDVTVVTPQLGGVASVDGRIVVDDGSDLPVDGATLRLGTNAGPAAARNIGRKLVTTPLIAFVDADVELGDSAGAHSWLDALLPHFDDERLALVAPRVAGEQRSPLDLGSTPARIRSGTRVSYVPAAAIVVRAEALDEVGGFDQRLRFGEDVDLVWRLDQAGWVCRYEPASTVWHTPRASSIARLRQHAGYGTAAAPLALRHPDDLSPAHSNGWTAAVWVALVSWHPLVAIGLAVGTAARLVPKLPSVPASRSFRLAIEGHARAGQQFAAAARRVWWPMVAVGALVSRRLRWAAAAAVVASPATTPTDMAYGWGVWVGMIRHRTFIPLIPRWRRWPNQRTR